MKTHLLSVLVLFVLISLTGRLNPQTKVLLWKPGLTPNRSRTTVSDSVSNDRVYRVSEPFMQVFEPATGNSSRQSVLVIPGGAYSRLAYDICGTKIARWLNEQGITAFVLYYRLPQQKSVDISYLAPLQDAQRAMKLIRANAARYGTDPNRVGVLGTSAGGHVAAGLCTIDEDWAACGDSTDGYSYLPDFAVLVSPVVSMADTITHMESKNNLLGNQRNNRELAELFSADRQVKPTTPQTMIVHAANDGAVPVAHSIAYFSSLMKAGVKSSSLHIFPQGGHNISVEKQPGITQTWKELVLGWIKEKTDNK